MGLFLLIFPHDIAGIGEIHPVIAFGFILISTYVNKKGEEWNLLITDSFKCLIPCSKGHSDMRYVNHSIDFNLSLL